MKPSFMFVQLPHYGLHPPSLTPEEEKTMVRKATEHKHVQKTGEYKVY
jgi:hypothetical protein